MPLESVELKYEAFAESRPKQAVFSLLVENLGKNPVIFEFYTGQEFDFVVLEGDNEVWRWSGDLFFIQSLHQVTLEAGKSLSYRAVWDYRDLWGTKVKPGVYTLQAYFQGYSQTEPVSQVEFTVP